MIIIPQIPLEDPCHWFDSVVRKNQNIIPTFADLFNQSSSETEKVAQLLALFGSGIAAYLPETIKSGYNNQIEQLNLLFEQICQKHLQNLILDRSITLDVKHPDDGLTSKQRLLFRLINALDLDPLPMRLIKEKGLEKIPNTMQVSKYIANLNQEKHAIQLLYRLGEQTSAQPIRMKRFEWIHYEICWIKRTPFYCSARINWIQTVKEWGVRYPKLQTIVDKFFGCLSLAPLLEPYPPLSLRGEVLTLDRTDVTLVQEETFGYFLAEKSLLKVFNEIAGGGDPNDYIYVCLTHETQQQLIIGMALISCSFPCKRTYSTQDCKQLAQTKEMIISLFPKSGTPCQRFLEAALLCNYLFPLIPSEFRLKQNLFALCYEHVDESLYQFWLGDPMNCSDSKDLTLEQNFEERVLTSPELFKFLELVNERDRKLILESFTTLCNRYHPYETRIHSTKLHEEARERLRSLQKNLEETELSESCYSYLFSLLLFFHISRFLPLHPHEKEILFQRILSLPTRKRVQLYKICLEPMYFWKRSEFFTLNLEENIIFVEASSDQKVFLQLQYGYYLCGLLPHDPLKVKEKQLPLNFYDSLLLLSRIKKKRGIQLSRMFVLLERQLIHPSLPEKFNTWENLCLKVRSTLANALFFPSTIVSEMQTLPLEMALLFSTLPFVKFTQDPDLTSFFYENFEIQPKAESELESVQFDAVQSIYSAFTQSLYQSFLPLHGRIIYQRFLYLFPFVENHEISKKVNWANVYKCCLHEIISKSCVWVNVEWLQSQLQLTIRFVDSLEELNTQTLKANLPISKDQFEKNQGLLPLMIELSEILCAEYKLDAEEVKEIEQIETYLKKEQSDLFKKLQKFIGNSNEKKSQITQVVVFLFQLKLGMRHALWEFLDSYPLESFDVDIRKIAARGSIWSCPKGLSLIPIPSDCIELNPAFTIAFNTLRKAARELNSQMDKTPQLADGQQLLKKKFCTITVLHKTELNFHVDCTLSYVRSSCWNNYDESTEETVESPIGFQLITLFLEDRSCKIADKFFSTLSLEQLEKRLAWLLVLLKSEWYTKN